jgi:hypothetical protein
MGNLTAAEKQRVLDTLDKMDRSTIERILGSIESFTNWLRDSLYSVYVRPLQKHLKFLVRRQ